MVNVPEIRTSQPQFQASAFPRFHVDQNLKAGFWEMDKLIDDRFAGVEKALSTLIQSIATYNPNPALAENLVTADTQLSRGLEELTTHQSNHARILSLRATSAALDTQIRDTLALLTATRKDLLATPSSNIPQNINPVSYAELLSYARRISKFTLPPTYRELVPETTEEATTTSTPKETNLQIQTNGNTTPLPPSAANGIESVSQTYPPSAMELDTASSTQSQQQSQNPTIASNNTNWSAYLNPYSGETWTPWPSEDALRRGALASIQVLLDQGKDPATFDPEKSAELEEERRLKMEEEERGRETRRVRAEEEKRAAMERRMSMAGTGAAGGGGAEREKPKVFQLEDLEDDDED